MSGPTADVSVRVAWADDAAGIAAVQRRAWTTEYVDVLPPELLDQMHDEQLAAAWHEALTSTKDARNRVLVALERVSVRGYVLTGASPDPDADPVADGEISELTVDPDHGRAGHGSRLIQAAVDTLKADRFRTARFWLAATDDVRRRFLADAGFAPDGAHRELDLDGEGTTVVKQIRMHAAISELPLTT